MPKEGNGGKLQAIGTLGAAFLAFSMVLQEINSGWTKL